MPGIPIAHAIKIVRQATTTKPTPPPWLTPLQPVGQTALPNAPVWFYSALAWTGSTFYDADLTPRRFANWIAGSDVDPYARLGSTRLFLIVRERDEHFRLTIAPDVASSAQAIGGTTFTASDAGISEMYLALSQSRVFDAVRYCYVPGDSTQSADIATFGAALQSGYDPATGLRAIVGGSAVTQAVPLDDFLQSGNQQICNAKPRIVPLASSVVFDVSANNTPGATAFTLPVLYSRDQLAPGVEAVNRLAGSVAVFSGGPGYDDAHATTLTVESTSTATVQGETVTYEHRAVSSANVLQQN